MYEWVEQPVSTEEPVSPKELALHRGASSSPMNTIQQPKSLETTAHGSEEESAPTAALALDTNNRKRSEEETCACEETSLLLRPTQPTSISIHKLSRRKEEEGGVAVSRVAPDRNYRRIYRVRRTSDWRPVCNNDGPPLRENRLLRIRSWSLRQRSSFTRKDRWNRVRFRNLLTGGGRRRRRYDRVNLPLTAPTVVETGH